MQKEKTLADVRGRKHKYLCDTFGAKVGFDLLAEITQMGGGAIASMLGGAKDAGLFDDGGEEKSDGQFALDVINGIGPDRLDSTINDFVSSVIQKGGSEFLIRLLSQMKREDENGEMKKLLANEFDRVYQGNYMELFQAIYFALEVNFLESLRANAGSS